ncbi:MAG: myxococcus cysteine-rich repeat containing protein [Candidatus Pacearchaeota archaeon]|nr:myxococcus cysteine-rich repeat containing protein [Candidatus Pacearchaeota archaeon]
MNKREDNFYSLSKSRKGLSAIVANLLIILLVLVAVGVIWVVIRNVISSGSEQIELGQFTFDLSIKSAYVSGTNIVVGVRRSPGGGELLGMKFIFSNETESKTIEKMVAMTELDERTFTFTSAEISGMNAGDEVSVAPVYSSSGAEKTGTPTDSATISGTTPEDGGSEVIPICGNGALESGEQCDDGNTISGDGCSSTCQHEEGSESPYCGDGNCDILEGENVLNCPDDCEVPSSCDGVWNPQDIEDGNECDGTPTPNKCTPSTCTCDLGFYGDDMGGCAVDNPLDTGTIFSVWNHIYFDSYNLPKETVSDFMGNYVNFSDSAEVGCFRINFADYLIDNDISYIRLDDSLGYPNIVAGNNYYIWEAENCGL